LAGRIYQLVYLAGRHFLFGWTITRWAMLVFLFGPLILFLTYLRTSPQGLLWLGLLFLLGLGGVITIWGAQRQGFLRFDPEPLNQDIPSDLLPFPDKNPARASGRFAVGGMTRYFVEEAAHYQTFHTRERVVMVQIFDTRYLWLAQSPENETGWWYTFFKPEVIRSFEPGQLCFGPHNRPALRLTYRPAETEAPQTIYLSFDTPLERAQVLADLYADRIEIGD